MASSLPLLVALRTRWLGSRCLAYDDQQKEGGNMWFSTREIVKPTTKFAVERSTNNNQLVHLRCCYSNKYLAKESATSYWINAAEEKPNEDTSQWSCTLFRPVTTPSGRIQFLHVQTGSFIGTESENFRNIETRLQIFLNSKPSDVDTSRYEVNVIDWDTLVVLPDQITFKGDNGKYLTTLRHTPPQTSATHILQFSTDDIGNAGVPHEISYNREGRIQMRNIQTGLSWVANRFRAPVLLLSGNGPTFWPVKATDNAIALDATDASSHAPVYLSRNPQQDDMLFFEETFTIAREARFEIEEPVLSRQISNVNFRLQDARIYDETPLFLSSAPATNNTQETHHRTVIFRYTETTESTWRTFHSIHAGIKMKFRAGMPIIGRFGVDIAVSYDGEYEWGETKTETMDMEDHYSFPVPPMTFVEARLIATKGKCDVPFSYTVRDVLTDGSPRVYEIDGGVYNGVNHYNLVRETTSHPLSRAKELGLDIS